MEYLINIAILVSIYSILGVGLNLVVGYAGLLSVTHAAFFGIGAYSTAILGTAAGLNFFLSLGAGILVAGVLSFIVGIVLGRLGGDYYLLGTVGFNYIVFSILLNWDELTRGPLGIPGIKKPEIGGFEFSSNAQFLFLSVAFLILVYLASRFIAASSFGRALKAIREDQEALQVFGYNALYYKLVVFVIGAGMAAIAGSFFASYITFIDPTSFTVMESVFILVIVILGGLASLPGSILGAVFLILLPELLRFVGFPPEIAGQARQLAYGLVLVLLMLYRPKGFLGTYKL